MAEAPGLPARLAAEDPDGDVQRCANNDEGDEGHREEARDEGDEEGAAARGRAAWGSGLSARAALVNHRSLSHAAAPGVAESGGLDATTPHRVGRQSCWKEAWTQEGTRESEMVNRYGRPQHIA